MNVEDGGDGPVSAADLAVNSWLLDGLQSHFTSDDWALLSEDTAKENLKEGVPFPSEWLWILDPLDGTKDFLAGTGEYAVHLALIRDHIPVLGVVLIPELEELWLGGVGIEPWCEDRNGNRKTFCFSNRRNLNELIARSKIASTFNHLTSFVLAARVYKYPLSITTVANSCLSRSGR